MAGPSYRVQLDQGTRGGETVVVEADENGALPLIIEIPDPVVARGLIEDGPTGNMPPSSTRYKLVDPGDNGRLPEYTGMRTDE